MVHRIAREEAQGSSSDSLGAIVSTGVIMIRFTGSLACMARPHLGHSLERAVAKRLRGFHKV